MSIQDCTVCLEAYPQIISCCNPSCSVKICPECFPQFLSHCSEMSVLPICVGQNCEALYLKQSIPSSNIRLYLEVCCEALVKSDQDKVDDLDRQKIISEQLKAERRTFLRKKIPIAVSTVAEIVFKSKLEKIKQPKTSEESEFKRRCMNTACPGILNSELVCDVCLSQFCEKCESILSETHQCKEEDLATVETKKSFPKCPNCQTPMDKDNACNHVKCGLCGTKFIYGTDQKSGGGGHTEMVEVKDRVRLSTAFRELLSEEILKGLLMLESLEIETPNYETVVKSVQRLIQSNKNKSQVVQSLNDYYRKLYQRRYYYTVLNEIEDKIKSGTLTPFLLTTYYQKFI